MEYTLGVVVILRAMTVAELLHEGQTHASANLCEAVGMGTALNWVNNEIALVGAYCCKGGHCEGSRPRVSGRSGAGLPGTETRGL